MPSSAAAVAHGTRCGGGDVAAAQRALLRVGGHVGALAGVFLGGAHIDQRLAEVRQHVGQVGADDGVVALDDRVVGG